MKTVINKTHAPLRVPLPRGKSLRLGPSKSGQVADGAADHAGLKKLVEAGKLEIFDGGDQQTTSRGEGGTRHESTHGHGGASIRKSGDR